MTEQKGQERQDKAVEVTLKTSSSRYVDGKYSGTCWDFTVLERGGKWYSGKIILNIKLRDEDLAALEIAKNFKEGLFNKFDGFKRIA